MNETKTIDTNDLQELMINAMRLENFLIGINKAYTAEMMRDHLVGQSIVDIASTFTNIKYIFKCRIIPYL